MSRLCVCTLFLACALGCQTPERAAVQPLPPDSPQLSYADLVQRASLQVGAAHEFFYRDAWQDVAQASTAMQETATILAKLKPEEVPAKHRDTLAKYSKELGEAAVALRDAGQAKDAIKTTEAFQRLHLAVRELRRE
jgi:hypothetical protein